MFPFPLGFILATHVIPHPEIRAREMSDLSFPWKTGSELILLLAEIVQDGRRF